ncbi:uncharacterized protein N7483_008853 [Penicillium malachiteum]|uniref:uncharacterized protein n=1 Tax=Penicillium malachiteum TaxID=1324776 RepID=UPI0025499A68|nr:uncharacterized protein N7483_008853 [Penicillium malachiteum]KAJ5720919.1 hypothetical protein N7483_008853 [Penicillium malachiteum]
MKLFWLLSFISPLVVAKSGVFYNPPTGGKIHDYTKNPVYTLGQTLQMRWTTTLASFSILLWQNDNADYEWVQTDISNLTSYDWIVSTNQNLSNGNVFFFQIRNASNLEDQDELFASHYFNITEKSSTATMSPSTSTTQGAFQRSAESKSSSVPLVASPTITTTSRALSTETAIATNRSNTGHHGLSIDTKVGIGVGAGAVGILVFAGGLFFCLRKRKLESSQVDGSQLNTNLFPSADIVDFSDGRTDERPAMIFEAPGNLAPNVFEAPTYDQRRVFEAPMNEKKANF